MEIDRTSRALIYLLGCAVNGVVPSAVPGLDYAALFELSRFHMVTAAVATALETGGLLTGDCAPAEVVKAWKDARLKAVRKNVLLDAEREQILSWFDREGIWYMPLKGAVLKDAYPKMGMRQMSDNDILFDPKFRRSVRDYMESRGYSVELYEKGIHDTYRKPPVYNFELHTELMSELSYPEGAEYYRDVKTRLKPDGRGGMGLCFGDEDFYVYFIAHGYKHFSYSGTGVRFLLDIYVLRRLKMPGADWGYVGKELEKLGISGFESECRELALCLFAPDAEGEIPRGLRDGLLQFLSAGTYGTVEGKVRQKLLRLEANGDFSFRTKLRYSFSRLFPEKRFMQEYSGFCRKHSWAIPVFWVVRIIRALFVRSEAAKNEIAALRKL